jgi:hypothetical protein
VDEQQRYLFDLQGYLTVPGALSPDTVQELNRELDEMIRSETLPDMRTHRFDRLLPRSALFRMLIDNPVVMPVLEELLGRDFRLDHDYADVIRSGLSPIGATLHGGAQPFRPAEFYIAGGGRSHSGLTVVAYNLGDVGPEDGGFACVPGSHKAAFAFPKDWRSLTEPHACVQRVFGPAGTAVVFTEALTHGPLPWSADHERRTIFFKYNAAPIAWSRTYYDAEDFADLSEAQRVMLRRPGVG